MSIAQEATALYTPYGSGDITSLSLLNWISSRTLLSHVNADIPASNSHSCRKDS